MANTKSAAKRARQAPVRTARNQAIKTGLKSRIKAFRSAVATGTPEEIEAKGKAVVSAFDKAAKKGAIHQNKADRNKAAVGRAATAKAKA